ncbi:amidase [Mycolicibacterium sp. J2]|uniref:amidase n=1 Tax=Mycolicibacterium sp. J2 TaxID=2993511 RepID=UPI00224AB071|nr:amidase [Mycolicibacterium sp. J2]MCX2715338.1 amidase [Mycolicibacterium sp. J2]
MSDIAFAGAAEHARMLAAGTVTAPDLLELFLGRIAQIDPEIRSYRVVLTESARAEAAAAQARLDAGERLPLLGVPVAIKDDTDIAGQVTTYGSSAHGPAVAADAEVVRRLRAAGAVILGKTAVPEMMIWPFTETLTYGATRNPWNRDFAPGGSSGGSGAAVAAGLASIALGSDGMGSIRIPSTWCGLFGIKPQRDRVPTAPHENSWCGLVANGPLARTVEDAALFLDVTAPGHDFVAAATRPPGRLRIAVSRKVPPLVTARVGAAQRAAVVDAAAVLRELGHHVVERDPDYPLGSVYGHALPRYFRGVYDDVRALPHPDRLDSRTRAFARIGALIPQRRMESVLAAEPAIAARVLSIFDDVDVVITPGAATGPSRIGAYQRGGAISTLARVAGRVPFQAMCNVTGQPAAVVPWGLDGDGIPMSIQLMGRPFDEATLLSLSAQLETARPWANRRPPVQTVPHGSIR